jgi:hypothetical protein
MQEIRLQPFIQEVLQKNTYNSSRNNHANPGCNTFLQEKLDYNHSFKKFCRKILTIHQEITMQTLVVTPSFKRNAKICQKMSSLNKCASLNQPITQDRAQISDLAKW